MSIELDLNNFAKQQFSEKDKFDFNTVRPVVEKQAQENKSELLQEISELFDRLGETENSAKKHWLGVWLKNKNYDPELSGKDMSREQLLELKSDIKEVLEM